ncbi:ABC transporter ATP-binding protein [Neorhizobium galegae]|uniref:ABC transporter ATP-binding protein n=1 Tax=Neorhizobium galegae TaxID=399 RepID=UPI000622555F|nr:ABC transporter ATP-binding protein [Neorhizobium galegae]CDZ42164.1 Oligogalacturonide ABC transporter, ATP-binding protein [Neorhizobium galegae bv. officinalis]KAA9383345.1 ABC transporter ATP-binding protein [Neorhizobium galegae]MCM2500313.1 ABC transporter ATP-binding protein [Neorhizobium galegae]MCQ1768640.1 ABC transporter ATP-binding protein [Neorhizobium galegae]MCQ1770844.1 ABC transporter ATP-binding protein [Neorhizobium galegae]
MARLQLRNLEKDYGSFRAVHGINLDVEDGEFMVLVGPSGCAKSTTLRMIAGLERVTGGEIRIGGELVNDKTPGDRGISMVFQNYALYPHMKVRKNLSFSMRLKRRPAAEIEQATQHVSNLLEIDPLLDRLPKQLSGGQAQRVAVGRALIKKPQVFLFDEPLSNLDAKLRASMRVRITDLHKRLKADGQQATVIYVTHDQTEAMTMGDRICVMRDGHIMQVADPVTLYSRPANTFVAGFIGSPEMNFLDGTFEGENSVRAAEQVIVLGDEFTKRISGRSEHVTLGIRPQHLRIVAPETPGTIKGKLTHIEFMGHEVYLYVDIGPKRLIAVVPSASYDRGALRDDWVWLSPDPKGVHLFDRQSGENISLAI